MKKPVARVLVACARELDALDADWAIGGAVAMGVHGYDRATADVDVFVGDDARADLQAALAARGIELVPTMAPMHYSIIPDRKKPDERVDVLFPALGVESLAIMAATRERVAGVAKGRLPVWPLAHLAAHKLVTDPAVDPSRAAKDGADLRELWARGLIETEKVRTLLEDVRDRGAIRRLATLVRGS